MGENATMAAVEEERVGNTNIEVEALCCDIAIAIEVAKYVGSGCSRLEGYYRRELLRARLDDVPYHGIDFSGRCYNTENDKDAAKFWAEMFLESYDLQEEFETFIRKTIAKLDAPDVHHSIESDAIGTILCIEKYAPDRMSGSFKKYRLESPGCTEGLLPFVDDDTAVEIARLSSRLEQFHMLWGYMFDYMAKNPTLFDNLENMEREIGTYPRSTKGVLDYIMDACNF